VSAERAAGRAIGLLSAYLLVVALERITLAAELPAAPPAPACLCNACRADDEAERP
jgi:hypothetical protein